MTPRSTPSSMPLWCCLVALFACDSGADADAEADDDASGDETGGTQDDDDAASTTGASDDDDGADTTGDDPTGGTTGDTDTGTAVGDDVFFFVRRVDASIDEVWAYDLGADAAHLAFAFDDGAEIRSLAIHPSRAAVAVASNFDAVDYQQSESIYVMPIGADARLGAPELLMEGLPKPIGASTGYAQQLDDLRWHPDGSRLWFDHSFFFDISEPGGGALASWDATTGGFTLYQDAIGDCTVNTGPSPSPDGSILLAIRGVCIDTSHEGVVAFGPTPAGEPEVVAPSTGIGFGAPRWLPDGAGITYFADIDYDTDGDGTHDLYGSALLLLDVTTGDQYVLLAPSADAHIWSFTMSPDGTRFVACVSHDGARDLLLVDYAGPEPVTRWLTEDGVSCEPQW